MNDIKIEFFTISFFTNSAPYDLPALRNRIDESLSWLKSEFEIEPKGRMLEYLIHINNFECYRGNFGRETFYCVHSIAEAIQIADIHSILKVHHSDQFRKTLKQAIYGISFRDKDPGKDGSRNFAFELSVAANYALSGLDVDLSTTTDVVVVSPSILVECKRVSSFNKIRARIDEAIDQIKKPSGVNPRVGVIHIDVTQIVNDGHVVFVINETGFPFSITPPSSDTEVIEDQRRAAHRRNVESAPAWRKSGKHQSV